MKAAKIFLCLALHVCAASARPLEVASWPDYQAELLTVEVITPPPDQVAPLTLKPLLLKPAGPAPWSVMVLPASCGGVDDFMWPIWVNSLVKNNIAVVLVDWINPRGFTEICSNQSRITLPQRLLDMPAVLDVLRKDGRFIKNKIALGGQSAGAVTALHSAYKASGKLLGREADGFNAFVAASPSCELSFRETKLYGPMLVISGEQDDWTLPEPCEKETARLRAAGEPVEFKLILGANHFYSTAGAIYNPRAMKAPADLPQHYFKKMGYTQSNLAVLENDAGEETSTPLLMRKYGGFLGSKLFGASVGGNKEKAPEVAELTVQFLKKNGW